MMHSNTSLQLVDLRLKPDILTLLKMELAKQSRHTSELTSVDIKISHLDLKLISKLLLQTLVLSLLLSMQDKAHSNFTLEEFTTLQDALLPISITESSQLDMEFTKVQITGSLRTHGELHGDFQDIL